jgi:hypothetical protein
MWQWIKARPWVWIVLFFLGVIVANMALVVIAIINAPVELPH